MHTGNDALLKAAQRDFMDDTPPVWELKPGERVCPACHLVHPCDCVGAF